MSECVKYRSLLTGRITTTSIDESKEECIQYANDRSSTLIKEPPMENRMPYNTMIGTRNENNRRHVSSDGNGYLRPRLGGRKGEIEGEREFKRELLETELEAKKDIAGMGGSPLYKATVEKYLELGGRMNDLLWDVKKDRLQLQSGGK